MQTRDCLEVDFLSLLSATRGTVNLRVEKLDAARPNTLGLGNYAKILSLGTTSDNLTLSVTNVRVFLDVLCGSCLATSIPMIQGEKFSCREFNF